MNPSDRKLGDKHKKYLLGLAHVYVKNSQSEKAIIIYEALWHIFSDTEKENIAFCLGYLYLKIRRFEKALFYADTYLKKKSSSVGFLVKAQILFRLGREQEAKEATHRFLTY
jgi:tetratricopeptide (TPR) repeat protein